MLHVLNFVVVTTLLLPVLTSSFPQGNGWNAVYDRRSAAETSGRLNPHRKTETDERYVCCNQPANRNRVIPYSRHVSPLQAAAMAMDNAEARNILLHKALEQLIRLQHKQQAPNSSSQKAQPLGPAAFLPESNALEDRYSAREQHDLMSRLLGARAAMASQGEPLTIQLNASRKRGGGFVGAPGSAGGPNMFGR